MANKLELYKEWMMDEPRHHWKSKQGVGAQVSNGHLVFFHHNPYSTNLEQKDPPRNLHISFEDVKSLHAFLTDLLIEN